MHRGFKSTVVIPIYNGERYLLPALESILRQTQLPEKIICVDDRSTDGSIAVCKAFGRNSPVPIEITSMPSNTGGPVEPMTVGINLAKTPYVTLLDQDDLMEVDRIEKQCKALHAFPAAVACAGMLVRIDSRGELIREDFEQKIRLTFSEAYSAQYDWGNVFDREKALKMVFNGGTLVVASCMTIQKELWNKIGGFDTKQRIAWDYEFSLRALRDSAILFVDSPIGHYRVHENNTSGNSLATMKEILGLRVDYLNDVFSGESNRKGKEKISQTARSVSVLETDRKKYVNGIQYAWMAIRYSSSPESLKCLLRAIVKRW